MARFVLLSLVLVCAACTSGWRTESSVREIVLSGSEEPIVYHEGALRRVAILPPAVRAIEDGNVSYMVDYGERLQRNACAYLRDWKGYLCSELAPDAPELADLGMAGDGIPDYLWQAVAGEQPGLPAFIRKLGSEACVDGIIVLTGQDDRFTRTRFGIHMISIGLVPVIYDDTASMEARFYEARTGELVWQSGFRGLGELTRNSRSFWRVIKLKELVNGLFDDIENALTEGLVSQ